MYDFSVLGLPGGLSVTCVTSGHEPHDGNVDQDNTRQEYDIT